ncbi:MAG: PadR family transcriptional regulator [Candidatus Thorarchaeota archaeon]
MIKRVKELDSSALIASPFFREYVEKQESEINRGISTLCILSIIGEKGSDGVHGYEILTELRKKTEDMLVIEEGTLYPILRKLEKDGLIISERESEGRRRKFYFITENGQKIFNYLSGFYSKLTEAIAPLFDVKVDLKSEKYLFCPMCANKIELTNIDLRFCDVCGHNIEKELKERGLKNE